MSGRRTTLGLIVTGSFLIVLGAAIFLIDRIIFGITSGHIGMGEWFLVGTFGVIGFVLLILGIMSTFSD